jgi:hypothetical protein
MMTPATLEIDPIMQAAITELQQMILAQYPTTVFTVGEAGDPEGVYVRAVVDVDDPDEVTELIIDRMIDLQVEDGLPLYVVPVRTPERTAIQRQQHRSRIRAISG